MLIRVLGLVITCAAALAPLGTVQAQPYGYDGGDAVDCSSRSYGYQHCPVPWRDAQIARQLSDSQCVRGRTWGFDPRGGFIWVDRGCSARFVGAGYAQGPGPGGPWRPGPGWDRGFEVSCGSPQFRYAYCAVDVGGGGRVSVRRQTSNASCVEGQTWGWNRGGIWVDKGCGAVFSVDRRWR